MKVACIILAHKYPQQLKRLITAISHPSIHFWVHIDRKSNLSDFNEIFELQNVFRIQPTTRVDWGCYNTVECMLNCLKAASNASERYEYYQFLSGMDYPIQPIQSYLDYLSQNKGNQFIGNRPLEESLQNINRFNDYHFNKLNHTARRLIEKLANTILRPRKFPQPFEIRKGPQWMALNHAAVTYLLQFSKSTKELLIILGMWKCQMSFSFRLFYTTLPSDQV